ncbi:MAG: hypothetical protein Ta2B_20420 [Termitinemataceae bacterium]|nr:MAG: hypothetical protein Ta2B_20420 [Termitinemataceae bacterium]
MLKFDTDDFFLFNSEEINDLAKKSASAHSTEEEALKRLFSSLIQFPNAAKKSSFVLPHGPKKDAHWVGENETVTVGDFTIKTANGRRGGFFYFGTYLPSRYSDIEPSLINKQLELDSTPCHFSKQHLPKFQEYSCWEPQERYSYLQWLAAGRPIDDDMHDWHLRVFLMGIERRITVDNECGLVKENEMTAIKTELFRIFNLLPYKSDILRRLYAGMLQLISINTKDKPVYADAIDISFYAFNELQIYVNIALGECAKYDVPMTAEIAFAYYECDKAFKLPASAKCCNAEFKNIFVCLYNKKYPTGIKLRRSSATFSNFYFSTSSPSLCPHIPFKLQETLPIVVITDSLIKKINSIATESKEIISNYANHIIKNHNNKTLKFFFLLLPKTFWGKRNLSLNDIICNDELQNSFLKIIDLAKDFNVKHKKAIVQFLLDDLCLGNLTSLEEIFKEISFLEKVYTNLGFDKSILYSNLYERSDALHNNTQLEQSDDKSTKSKIGAPEVALELDANRITKLREDSEQVCNLLSDIFCEEKVVVEEKRLATNPILLDKKHSTFLLDIIKKKVWEKNDLQQCAKTHGLMIDGAIEIINEATFNSYNESLIEEDDVYHCNQKIAKKIIAEIAA